MAGVAKPDSSPFGIIPERNVFRLRPVPPPEVAPPPPVPLPEVMLKGITTMLGDRRALFSVKFPGTAAGSAKEEDYFLREGEKDGPIEVLKIDLEAEKVALDVSGMRMEVTFMTNATTVTAPAVQAPPPSRRMMAFHRRTN